MTTTTKLNTFEKSLEKLAETIYHSDNFSNIYSIHKGSDNKKNKIYSTQYNGLDVSLDVFSIYALMNYKLTVSEKGKPIGSVRIDQGDPNENWLGEKYISYTLASVNIDNDEKVKKDLTSAYLKDIVKHMQQELDGKLKLQAPMDEKEVDYHNVLDRIKKIKQAQKEDKKSTSQNKLN